jgi:phage tail tape-measure protein
MSMGSGLIGAGAGLGATGGAALGATVGSIVPVVGTAIGAGVGGVLGGATGALGTSKALYDAGSAAGKSLTQATGEGLKGIGNSIKAN